MTIPKGEIGVIRLCVFPEYKNEEYHVEIYNSAGQLVATAEDTYYNSSSTVRYFNITVNTNKLNMGVGTYTVKYWMSFYSLSELSRPGRTCRPNASMKAVWSPAT